MDNRTNEKSTRDERLWLMLVILAFGLGLVWLAGA